MESILIEWELDVRSQDRPFIVGVSKSTCFSVRDAGKVDSCQLSHFSVVITA